MSIQKTHRRQFLKCTGSVAIGFAGLHRLLSVNATAQPYQNQVTQLGKLVRDPQRIMDLPEGFTYKVLSSTGDMMSDGLKTPGSPDGMGAFTGENGEVVLVRNHELEDQKTFEGAYGLTNELLDKVDPKKMYDAGKGIQPQLGGTSNIVYDPEKREVVRQLHESGRNVPQLCWRGRHRGAAGSLVRKQSSARRVRRKVEDAKKAEEKKAKKEAEKTDEEKAKEKAEARGLSGKAKPKAAQAGNAG